MTVCYQTRYEDGVFIGTAQAYPDPREPDRLVLPGACVDVAPPAFQAGQQARWSEGAWHVEPVTFVIVGPGPVGLAVSWDGTTLNVEERPQPELTDGQTARWDGARWTVQDAPPQPRAPLRPMTPAEKLAATGLSVADLKALLAGS